MKIYLYTLHLARYQGSVEGLIQVVKRLSRIGQTPLAGAASGAAQDLAARQAAAVEDAPEDSQPLTRVAWQVERSPLSRAAFHQISIVEEE